MPASRRAEISEALRQRIVNAAQLPGLAAGDRLPSARVLAKEMGADARVVAATYRALVAEGVVERHPPSRGYFLASDHTGAPVPAMEWLVNVFVEGLARGIHARDLPEHAHRAIHGARIQAACIECNTDQQVWLCRELEEDYGIVGTAVDPLAARDAEPPLAIVNADLVVTTQWHETPVRELCERLGKPLIVVSLRPDLTARVDRLLATTPVYFIGTDPRFAEKIERQYRGTNTDQNVRPLIVGRDDIGAIPAGSHAWVMRTARDALGGVPGHVQALSTLRAFATDTQRAVLQFVVRANLQTPS